MMYLKASVFGNKSVWMVSSHCNTTPHKKYNVSGFNSYAETRASLILLFLLLHSIHTLLVKQ